MPTNSDIKKQLKQWVRELERAGYVVELDGTLYKVRNPDGEGLLTTFTSNPRGYRSLQNSMTEAKRSGIKWGQEAKRPEPRKTPPGAGPPIDERSAANALRQRRDHVAERVQRVMMQVGGTRAEFARYAMAETKDWTGWRPASAKAAEQQLLSMATGKGMAEQSLDFWEHVVSALENPEPPVQEEPVVPPPDPHDLAETIGSHVATIRRMRAELTERDRYIAELKERVEELEASETRLTGLNERQAARIDELLAECRDNEGQITRQQEQIEEILAAPGRGEGIPADQVALAFRTTRTVLVRAFPEVDADLVDDAFKLGREVAGLE